MTLCCKNHEEHTANDLIEIMCFDIVFVPNHSVFHLSTLFLIVNTDFLFLHVKCMCVQISTSSICKHIFPHKWNQLLQFGQYEKWRSAYDPIGLPNIALT